MKINEKIKAIRESQSLTQENMADKLGMSVTGYAKIERGETRSNLPRLEQISKVFDMDIYELLSYGENGQIYFNHSDNTFGDKNNFSFAIGHNDLQEEVKHLQLIISHKEEMLEQKDELINSLKRELNLLRKLTKQQ